ncbi:MAG: transporter [Chlorobium sp.]|jgi:hypothetical protein|nr:MAG: transporter [Chlorobium sp.]
MIKRIPPIILALLWSVPAFAAHPLMTDDTGTQGKGKFQFEYNGEYSRDDEHEAGVAEKETSGTLTAALTYGMTDNLDIVVGLPWQWGSLSVDGNLVSNDNGIGDTSVEVKWRFFECKKEEFSVALKPKVIFPTGDAQKGLGNGNISGGVLLIATKEWEHRALHGNIGYTHNSYALAQDNAILKQDIWHASVAAEFHMTEKLRSVADVSIDSNNERTADPNRVFLLGGLIYSVNDTFDLDLGVKAGLNHAETDKTILAGLTTRF